MRERERERERERGESQLIQHECIIHDVYLVHIFQPLGLASTQKNLDQYIDGKLCVSFSCVSSSHQCLMT